MKPVKTAVIGCGAISDIYLSNMMKKFKNLDVVSCSASHREHAENKAAQYGIRAAATEEIFKDPAIELVVVLTPAPSHYELVKNALLAGKHVYTEKTIAVSLSQAQELVALADEKGLRLGAAPETFMGSAFQTARKALDEGMLGDLTSFHITANRDLTFLASLFKFLRLPGGGICYDYGVYYLTALVSLLGPVDQVFARVGNYAKHRTNMIPYSPEYGVEYIYDNEAQVNALLTLKNGVTGTFSLNGDSAIEDLAYFTLQGTKGILTLGDANQFGGEIRFLHNDPQKCKWQKLKSVSTLSDNCRGVGVADLARSIREGGPHQVDAKMGCHVLDVIEKIIQSGKTGQLANTETVCERPAPFTNWKDLLQ